MRGALSVVASCEPCSHNAATDNARVARFLGYDMASGNPMMGAEWVLHLVGLRDAAVTAIIEQNKPKERTLCSHTCCACASRARDRGCWGGACEPCSR